MLRAEQFGIRPRHSTSLQSARLVERITRNFSERRLTGAVFLDVAKAFDTVWIEGLLYKLTVLNFPSYLVHIISSYHRGRTFEAFFLTVTSSLRGMRAGGCRCYNPSVFALLRVPLGTLVTGRLTKIRVFLFSPTTSVP